MATFQQLPSGLWRAQVKHAGKRRWTKSAPTKGDARTLAAKLLLDMEGDQPGKRRSTRTVGDLIDRHLALTDYSPTTKAEIDRALSRIPESFLNRDARLVDADDVDDLYLKLVKKYPASAVRRIHELLSASYNRALRWCRVNPCTAATPPAKSERDLASAPPGQLAKVAKAIDGDFRFAAFIRLATTTGARRGELCGLRWGDLDLEQGKVSLTRSVAYTPASGLVVKDVKTKKKGHRVVSIDPATVASLKLLRTKKGTAHLAHIAEDAYVFQMTAKPPDRPPRPDWATKKWTRICAELGVEGVRLHDLRHFSASRLLGAGVDPVTVAGRLGHSSPRTTLSIYAHALPERDREAAEVIAREMASPGGR